VVIGIRRLSKQESEKVFTSDRVVDLNEYLDALRDLQEGDAQITIDEATRRTQVRRFNAAAKQLGVKLKWKYTDEGVFVRIINPTGKDINGTS
jgi:hypothetical protein